VRQAQNSMQKQRIRRRGRGIPCQFRARSVRGNGYIKDLTLEGLFVTTHPLPRAGEDIVLRIVTADKKHIKVGGIVWWTTAEKNKARADKPGFAVRLLEAGAAYEHFFKRIPPE
jgi:Tfp pilus assembly protein PilZ